MLKIDYLYYAFKNKLEDKKKWYFSFLGTIATDNYKSDLLHLVNDKMYVMVDGKEEELTDFTPDQPVYPLIYKFKPNIVFYYAGQSSPAKSFTNKRETYRSNFLGCKNFLEVIKAIEKY